MKPDHRHELKTNELAEWLSTLPQWAQENRITIIGALIVIIAVAGFYFWRIHSKNVTAQKQLELTGLAGQLLGEKMQILQAREQGRDISFILLQPAENLRIFAQNTNDNQMAAFALIKRAEALRTELHYRVGTINKQDLMDQMDQAKASYTEALEKLVAPAAPLLQSKTAEGRPTNPSLTATAKFGLGLCEEELGNFDKAEEIYRDITANPDFESTVAAAQAKQRLETMADYKQKVVFKPSAEPAEPTQPAIQYVKPTDVNLSYKELNIAPEILDINVSSRSPNTVPDIPDINLPGK